VSDTRDSANLWGNSRVKWASLLGVLGVVGCREVWGIGRLPQDMTPEASGGSLPLSSSGGAPCQDNSCQLVNGELHGFSCSDGEASQLDETCRGQCDPHRGRCIGLQIDKLEVTTAEFEPFLDNLPAILAMSGGADSGPNDIKHDACPSLGFGGEAPAECLKKQTCDGAREDCSEHPAVCVSWCEAWTFCRMRGQHLCGSLRGATLGASEGEKPEEATGDGVAENAWVNACDGALVDPPAVNLRACEKSEPTTYPVHDEPRACRDERNRFFPGYTEYLGFLGNAREWTNQCDHQGCVVRGPSYLESDGRGCSQSEKVPRDARLPDVGFRCCGTRNPEVSGGGGIPGE
jgi:formylglycine-generating enzyme required for sulfatase activity